MPPCLWRPKSSIGAGHRWKLDHAHQCPGCTVSLGVRGKSRVWWERGGLLLAISYQRSVQAVLLAHSARLAFVMTSMHSSRWMSPWRPYSVARAGHRNARAGSSPPVCYNNLQNVGKVLRWLFTMLFLQSSGPNEFAIFFPFFQSFRFVASHIISRDYTYI